MKKPQNNNTETQRSERPKRGESFSVSNARLWEDSNKVTFNLNYGPVTIYGCQVIEHKGGDFIAFPCRKAQNGEYYKHAYIKLTDDEQAAIIHLVEEELAKNGES